MTKKREHAVFPGAKLEAYAEEAAAKKTATALSDKLLSATGSSAAARPAAAAR